MKIKCLFHGHNWLIKKDRKGNIIRECWICGKREYVPINDIYSDAKYI